jgi:predicted transcriptional regulator
MGAVTIRLDEELERWLEQVCERAGLTRSDVMREALRRQLALMQFEQMRARVMPFAEAQGYLVDDDVFREVS